jgi:hypothetical protein
MLQPLAAIGREHKIEIEGSAGDRFERTRDSLAPRAAIRLTTVS